MKNLFINKKQRILTLIFLVFIKTASFACDVCGSGVGNYYLNNISVFQKNFAGIRYRYMSFDSHVMMHPSLRTRENFRTAEFLAGYYITEKIQLMAFVPYANNMQVRQTQTIFLNGISDISLIANYQLYRSPTDTMTRNFTHKLRIGGGLKLPTGKYIYEQNAANQVANPNFQLGSGSTDFLANLVYTIRHKKIGLNTDISLKINTANAQKYRFGNKINGNIALFALLEASTKIILMPSVGFFYEKSEMDKQKKDFIRNSGGSFCAASIGLDVYISRKISLGCNYQIPLYQNLADGQIIAYNRLMAQLQYMF